MFTSIYDELKRRLDVDRLLTSTNPRPMSIYDELKKRLEEAKTERKSGIKFDNCIFSEPQPINSWSPPYRAGLYAIMVHDRNWTPRPFRVIYFGESGNISERGFLRSHHKYWDWVQEAGTGENLYISVHLMPNSTFEQRKVIETKLIAEYSPVCNKSLRLQDVLGLPQLFFGNINKR